MSEKLDSLRTKVNWREAEFTTYSLQGKPQEDLTWCNLSWDDASGSGFFLIRFAPGGISIPHEHLSREEFVLLEGDLEDNDGHVYRAGDCVSLAAGSKHFTRSKKGATTAVFVHGGFRTLPKQEVPAAVFDKPKRKVAAKKSGATKQDLPAKQPAAAAQKARPVRPASPASKGRAKRR